MVLDALKEISSIKQRFRRQMKERLKKLTKDEYHSFNQRLSQRFLNLDIVRTATTIMLYYSIGREVSTIALIRELLSQGKRVGLPICTPSRNLEVGQIVGLEQVQPKMVGSFSLMEPMTGVPLLEPAELELIVLPGLTFDKAGYRLGHGAGYYDRFLQEKKSAGFRLGLAYPFQVVDKVPVAAHDAPLDGLLTPYRYYDFH